MRWTALLLLLGGCLFKGDSGTKDTGPSVATGSGTGSGTGTGTGSGTGGGSGSGTGGGTGTGAGTGGGTGTGSGSASAAMCARWNSDRATLTEGSWSGSVGSCTPGTLSRDAIDSTVRLVNLYRWLADLAPVTDNATYNTEAQACSLMMDANNRISHAPSTTWTCYTSLGADGASHSNLATTPAVTAIDLYMTDYGNSDTLGHRRWILSNWLGGEIGVGGTPDYSCLQVIHGFGGPGPDWTAFPSPGPFPMEAMTYGSWASVDQEGWSIQSDSFSFSGASVTVTKNGQSLPVNTATLPGNYGSGAALSIRPAGWTTSPGVYSVSVTGLSQPIEYDVEFVDCP